jgi:hypothetical protein
LGQTSFLGAVTPWTTPDRIAPSVFYSAENKTLAFKEGPSPRQALDEPAGGRFIGCSEWKMRGIMRTFPADFFLILAAAAFLAHAGSAQMPTYSQAGPVPPVPAAAKTIFVSNAGSDSGLFPEPFSGDTDRPYTEFHAALKANGNYTLVGDPAQADLVLELRLFAPYGSANTNKEIGASDPLPMFRLVVYDGKTHYILWTVTRSIATAVGRKTHDKNFDAALTGLLNQFLQIAGKPPAPAH